VGITRLEDANRHEFELGHLRGAWTFLSEAAGSVGVGLRRIELPAGGWSTPAHEHGAAEEIFYVLAGSGLSWQDGRTTRIAAGDCIVYLPRSGPHTLHAVEALDVLAFGPRVRDEAARFPRLGLSLVGSGAVETVPSTIERTPIQFVREAELGPPDLPEPGPRPANVINLSETVADVRDGRRVRRTRRNLGRAAGSKTCGVQHVEVAPGGESAPAHCHSAEEEIFVILSGAGVLVLGEADGEIPIAPGHVVARPPATRIAHMFRAGEGGLEYLAFGTREAADLCFYPRSNKIAFGGIGVVARIERLDYWDGED
jgi:uncharacterized cupin superfamily protein